MYIDSTTNQNQSNLKKIIDELNDEVEEYSNNGIIVIGTDLNCDFSRKDDNWRSKLWFEFLENSQMKAINFNKRPVKTHKATNSTTASVIDYIFLKERDTGLVHSSAVGIAKNTDIRSDHRPVMLRLKWMKCLKPKKYIEKKLKPNEIQ